MTEHGPPYAFYVDGIRYEATIPQVIGAQVHSAGTRRGRREFQALRDRTYKMRHHTGPRWWQHPEVTADYRIDLRFGHVPHFYTVPPCRF